MKKSFLFSLLGVVAMLTGCNSETTEPMGQTGSKIQTVSFTLTTDKGVIDRAASDVNSYKIEAYSDATCTTAVNIFDGATKSTATSTDGNFTMTIDRSKAHYLLCWAENSTGTAYTTTNLKAVKLTTETDAATEAWAGFATIAADPTNQAVTIPALKRVVGKMTLKETGIIPLGKAMTLSFNQPTTYNVLNGVASVPSTVKRDISITTTAINGTALNPVVLRTDDYLLASTGAESTVTISYVYDGQTAVEIANVPFSANFNTNITGHYSSVYAVDFALTCDDNWEATDKDHTK